MHDARIQPCNCCVPGNIHATATIKLPYEAFTDYCTENGVLPDRTQLQSFLVEELVRSNDLGEIFNIELCRSVSEGQPNPVSCV